MSYGDSTQWTEVRYGRRSRLPRNTFAQGWSRDRLRTGPRGMASAFPVRRGGGPAAHTMPNPPVPPLGFLAPARSQRPLLGDGPQRRLYADVVRQTAPRRPLDHGFFQRDFRGPGCPRPCGGPGHVVYGGRGSLVGDSGILVSHRCSLLMDMGASWGGASGVPSTVFAGHCGTFLGGGSAAVQGPAQVQRSPDAVATHGEVEQRPLRDCGTSVEVGGELQGLHGSRRPARATCSVATMTDGRSAGPADWEGRTVLTRGPESGSQFSKGAEDTEAHAGANSTGGWEH
ncbi:hypothetical protein Q5P01_000295 [Channa striata]|uniref:Uncharacterized protein n=1 Tax=Channa striata TaxID=64152 RepID=A0AA88IHE6_CHASR|nr:hypothetical protein Q5P01_000295 [Channa striata]